MPRIGMSAAAFRAKAIDIALTHVRRHGFERVRLGDVAKELGVSHVALYSHFVDKAALLEAVTERWLEEVNTKLSAICASERHPGEKIHLWFVELYRLKRERILSEPELYRAFDTAMVSKKQCITMHLAEMRKQLLELVQEATEKPDDTTTERIALLLFEATTSFHHPKLVAEHSGENREWLLRFVLNALMIGTGLASPES